MKKVTVENAWFQQIEALKNNRNKRYKLKTFLVEGVKNINEVLKNKWEIDSIIYSDYNNLSDWAKGIIKENKKSEKYELSYELMKKLSDKEETSELMLLVKMKDRNILNIQDKKDLLIVVFDRPVYPGNLGTIMRSCDALKVDALIVTGHSADVYDSNTIRASLGTVFSLPIYKLDSHKELLSLIEKIRNKHDNFKIIGTSANTNNYLNNVDYNCPIMLLVGNETSGLSKGYKDLSNTLIKIPMYGSASSYNVGCATSMILYEVIRQRGF